MTTAIPVDWDKPVKLLQNEGTGINCLKVALGSKEGPEVHGVVGKNSLL